MLKIEYREASVVVVRGRLDAAQAPVAQDFLDQVPGGCMLDLGELEYISSAGLGVLLRTHKRMVAGGQGLRLINVNKHICDIFSYSGFDKLFEVQPAGSDK